MPGIQIYIHVVEDNIEIFSLKVEVSICSVVWLLRLCNILTYIFVIPSKFVETKEVNKEEENGTAILLTNVLELTVNNGQQPKEPIRVVIPIHDQMDVSDNIVVLTSTTDQPEDSELDWEIRDATINPDGKSAFFYVNHFSL